MIEKEEFTIVGCPFQNDKEDAWHEIIKKTQDL